MSLTRPRLLATVAAVSLVALSGCSSSSGERASTAAGSNADSGNAASLPLAAGPPAGTDQFGTVGAGKAAGSTANVEHQAVIKIGDVAIRTSHPQWARDRVDTLLTRLQGSIDDENTVYDKHGSIRVSHLVLRVPVSSFTTAVDDLEHLGKVVHSTSTAKDVTTEVIDIQQRLKTLRISLNELNSFQRQAANIDQLLRFENAITQRRGEYQSLKSQRDYLTNQTSMSTINLDLSVPRPVVAAPRHDHHAGFLTGLQHGWAALTGTVLVALTVVGAVLPFAVLLVIVGVPVWWWVRRTWRTPPVATPSEDAAQ